MPRKKTVKGSRTPATYYDPAQIEDAPEFHELSRALGTLTWGTWDDGARPFQERVRDFTFAHPPSDPVVRTTGRLRREKDRSFAPGDRDARLARFIAPTWEPGSVHELLSRYGLRLHGAPPFELRSFVADPARDAAKRRNVRLRVLHGSVDIEPGNMDAAKAEYVDREEKRQAAQQVRAARNQMREELKDERAKYSSSQVGDQPKTGPGDLGVIQPVR